jgi:ABC-type dipeptide/oligopeptide/nickel transport system permease subunit
MADTSVPVTKNAYLSKQGFERLIEQQELLADEMERRHAPRKHINWSLLLGSLIVFLVLLLAFIGPSIAPRDPMEENVILQIDGKWLIPPFPLFTHGFPFGSDDFGRDLYSRILWGIRPTIVMVTIVAVIRLLIGILIGLTSGWYSGRLARLLDSLIELALAIPVLLVALCVIAIIGVEFGIWAFILGLAITGWVETAQQVREQTRIVRGQSYIEASRSLGSLNRQILTRHVRKQITPLLVMLFAFEMSSTLMTTAGLGFLGYYIGGDVWVDVDDFIARRISGMPELGQMLATSWITLTKPWAMVVVGTMIFITILGFNLLGEGLRQNLEILRVGRRSAIGHFKEKGVDWFDQNIWHPLAQVVELPAVRKGAISGLALLILALVIGFSFLRWFEVIPAAEGNSQSPRLGGSTDISAQTPRVNGTQTATGFADAVKTEKLTYNPGIAWELEDRSGFNGGLALSKDQKRIYVASQDGTLYALDLEGRIIWQFNLPAGGVGTPAIAQDGSIIVSDMNGGLTKVNPSGEPIWHFQIATGNLSHSGPIIDKKGNIYYTVGTMAEGYVQSVSPDGNDRWITKAKTLSFFRPPILSADEKMIYLKNDIFSSDNGELMSLNSELNVLTFFSGEDGKDYLVSGNKVIQWQDSGDNVEVIDVAEWDTSNRPSGYAPTQVGVSSQGVAWLFYTSPGGGSQLIWVTLEDQTLGEVDYAKSSSILIEKNLDHIAYLCGGDFYNESKAECAAFSPENPTPLWKLDLGNNGRVKGGVYADGILFVTTNHGKLFAISETASVKTTAPTPTAMIVETITVPPEIYLPLIILDSTR